MNVLVVLWDDGGRVKGGARSEVAEVSVDGIMAAAREAAAFAIQEALQRSWGKSEASE